MNREKEIIEAANQRTMEIFGELDDFQDRTEGFIDGANWADKTMIDKVCEWLEDMDFEFEYHYSEDGFVFFDKEKFINDFRKAMEE